MYKPEFEPVAAYAVLEPDEDKPGKTALLGDAPAGRLVHQITNVRPEGTPAPPIPEPFRHTISNLPQRMRALAGVLTVHAAQPSVPNSYPKGIPTEFVGRIVRIASSTRNPRGLHEDLERVPGITRVVRFLDDLRR